MNPAKTINHRNEPSSGIRQLIEAYQPQFERVLPEFTSAKRFVRVALTATTRNPKLMECDQASFFLALLRLAELGLEPDGYRAHLIPFENRKRGVLECQLIIDYKGLAELVLRSGHVSDLQADCVCENDHFEYDTGVITSHKIDFRKPRGNPFAFYARAILKSGVKKYEVMSLDDVNAVRARSKARDSGPWVTDFNEMAKKTVFKRMAKWLPLTPSVRDALDIDDDRNKEPIEVEPVLVTSATGATGSIVQPVENNEPKQNFVSVSDTTQDLKVGVNADLEMFITESGFTLDDLLAWGNHTGNIEQADSIGSFVDIPAPVCKRLLRAKEGLIKGLRTFKSGNP